MLLNFEGQCRRVDLHLRAKHPYLHTRLFKIEWSKYIIFVSNYFGDFEKLSEEFNYFIKFAAAPISILNEVPKNFEQEILCISDQQIPSSFEGVQMTNNDVINHIYFTHPQIGLSEFVEDHSAKKIIVRILKNTELDEALGLQKTLDRLQIPYEFEILRNGCEELKTKNNDDVFEIGPAKAKVGLNFPFLESEEKLWYDNLEGIYSGEFTKSDLYFFEPRKSSCLLDFSCFQNLNLRNHLLLYDVIYCILPLNEYMLTFLEHQKITKQEILYLVQKGRLKILNIQPEFRVDHGFLNEIHQTNNNSIISRLGISALCATNLVEMNKSYIFNDQEVGKFIVPALLAISETTGQPFKKLVNWLFWPQTALRSSFETLSRSGPMSIARYGVNNLFKDIFPHSKESAMEFEFAVNSTQIHIAHALDATYFPFFSKDEKYSDHPYTTRMGQFLNFFQSATFDNFKKMNQIDLNATRPNLNMQLIDTFEIDDYVSIHDFEQEISSEVVRKGMRTLFMELNELEESERTEKINSYNQALENSLKSKKYKTHGLDLAEDLGGVFMPLLGSAIKIALWGSKETKRRLPAIQKLSDILEEIIQSSIPIKRDISLLSRVNRVARLKKKFD